MTDPHQTLGVSPDASAEELHRAYRELARRWHPDRFPEGPDRLWAEQKMVEINSAYNACFSRCAPQVNPSTSSRYGDVRKLIAAGRYSLAHKLLRTMEGRDAEWNYHFGNLLMQKQDYQKALVFLRIAHLQEPDNQTYAEAFAKVQELTAGKPTRMMGKLKNLFRRKAV